MGAEHDDVGVATPLPQHRELLPQGDQEIGEKGHRRVGGEGPARVVGPGDDGVYLRPLPRGEAGGIGAT